MLYAEVTQINSNNKCDEVVEKVLELIIRGFYKPGDRLPSQDKLAEQFGVSRITIRESFKMLSMMNIVSIRQGEGTYINKLDTSLLIRPLFTTLLFDTKNITELYEARVFIESGTASLAARNRTQQDLNYLREDIMSMDKALKEGNSSAFNFYDHQFHYRISIISGNGVLQNTLSTFIDLIKLYREKSIRTPEHMRISHERHRLIYDAIAQQDEDKAARIMADHISCCRLQIIESITKEKTI